MAKAKIYEMEVFYNANGNIAISQEHEIIELSIEQVGLVIKILENVLESVSSK